jgi:hypothetical protein
MENFDYKKLDNISLMELIEDIKSELKRRENKTKLNVGDCFYYKNTYDEIIIHYVDEIKDDLIYLDILTISDYGTIDQYTTTDYLQNYECFSSDNNEVKKIKIDNSVYFSIKELYEKLCEAQKQLEKGTAIEALQLFNTLTK